jgi:hypothetical protein
MRCTLPLEMGVVNRQRHGERQVRGRDGPNGMFWLGHHKRPYSVTSLIFALPFSAKQRRQYGHRVCERRDNYH